MSNINIQNLIITEICGAVKVKKAKDEYFEMQNRQSIGLSFKLYGKSEFYQNEKIYYSDENNIILMPKDSSYSVKSIDDSDCIIVNFNANNADSIQEILQIPISWEIADSITRAFREIFDSYGDELKQYRCMARLYRILDLLFSNNFLENSQLNEVVEYIENNISKPNITNAELAKIMGYSEVYFRKMFFKQFGISPIKFVISKRINCAMKLLSSNCSVTETAEKCGFNSVFHFSREFKKLTVKTPTEFSKQNYAY